MISTGCGGVFSIKNFKETYKELGRYTGMFLKSGLFTYHFNKLCNVYCTYLEKKIKGVADKVDFQNINSLYYYVK